MSPQPTVWIEWEYRKFDNRKITLPFPYVSIAPAAFDAIERNTSIALHEETRATIERLVSGRVFNINGFTDFGSSYEGRFPARARSELREALRLIRDLRTALRRCDKVSDGRCEGHLNSRIEDRLRVSPHKMLDEMEAEYSRQMPGSVEEKRIGSVQFIIDARDQVIAPAIGGSPNKSQIVGVVEAINKHVLIPLDKCTSGVSAPGRKRPRSVKPPRATLGGPKTIRTLLEQHVAKADEQNLEVQESWRQSFARLAARGIV